MELQWSELPLRWCWCGHETRHQRHTAILNEWRTERKRMQIEEDKGEQKRERERKREKPAGRVDLYVNLSVITFW